MSTVRVIKKYPNRRLYDTEDSRYITLCDVRELVLRRVDFVVVDKRNGRDITRCVLLQVISEREQGNNPMLSQAVLSQIIRAHAGAPSAPLSAHLEQSLSMFLNQCGRAEATLGSSASGADAGASVRRWKPHQDEAHRRGFSDAQERSPVGQEQISPQRKKAS
jgi:polyhydroxyalkanoate synthesis repressor PhaR